ncbi:ribosome silencing factor [Fructobacillus parabroussonetiae]|uniref:Ribosomal silencing factor RsfS n=1 Tax=Fructobacillus parabroussonetiae TaxID=2713174 RepID=A0ABS5QX99_9LACO|nr:ribosome silencing factor [Fructobacillus parabroussonetiae]MBS9337824.1 ribosome silencing factor [Fructobacillus parabroussonetiae]MCK8617647.1 ribosome silencing factor [Fructobacillus parabroussonetiae]
MVAESKELLQTVLQAIDNKRGEDLTALDMSGVSLLADYFVLASAGSTRQVQAIAREVKEEVVAAGYPIDHIEGFEKGQWVVLDLGDVIVHVFDEESRDFYHLDKLWFDAKAIDLSEYIND